MKRFLRHNGLSLVVFAIFLAFWAAQSVAGFRRYNEAQVQGRQPTTGYLHYLRTGDFWEATAENWESEFLQMAMFLVLTAFLVQKGSAESHPPAEEMGPEEKRRQLGKPLAPKPDSPWPVRYGGIMAELYSYSLTLTLFALFVVSFLVHAYGGALAYNHEQALQGHPTHYTMLSFLGTSEFWFQSFQNWQSEFLAVVSLAVLSIWLRQRGSPESKPVEAPSDQTGEE